MTMRKTLKGLISIPVMMFLLLGSDAATNRPNVVFIAVDDLNDWVGCLGGYPGTVHTPNLDSLAQKGMLFTRAYCSSTMCNPSRVALWTGKRPSTTGVYGQHSQWNDARVETTTIFQTFKDAGYKLYGGGKIFHHGTEVADDPAFDDLLQFRQSGQPDEAGTAGFLRYGTYDSSETNMPDYEVVSWCSNKLNQAHAEPFFIVPGIFKPHAPLWAPQKYFDMYPTNEIVVPITPPDEFDDIPQPGIKLADKEDRYDPVADSGNVREAIQGYLACVTFADEQIGRMVDAIEASPYATNTIIVLWSDHGFHWGEKFHFAKSTLWEESARMPFIIYAPGITDGADCDRPMDSIDIYPTLCDLAGIAPPTDLDGVSMVPLLNNPTMPWKPAVTMYHKDTASIRSEDFRYIRYDDGTEELYDHQADSGEHTNLVGDVAYDAAISNLQSSIPAGYMTNALPYPFHDGWVHPDIREEWEATLAERQAEWIPPARYDIQQLIDQLPAGRESIATVTLSGTYTLDQSLVLPNYTRLDLSDARLVLADGADVPMVVNSDTTNGNHHIEIIGGVLDGNRDGQSGRYQGISFVRAGQVRIMDVEVMDCGDDAIRLNGKGQHTRDVVLKNLRLSGSLRGLNVMWAMRNVFVSDVVATGNEQYGIRSDHSEGLYRNICANDNDGVGIFIRNIFGGSYNNLTATRNGGVGIWVQGMVNSLGSNWHAHNNSADSPGTFSDIFFDPDASLSYGITTNTLLSNISVGPVPQYGDATEKLPVEFGEGVEAGLLIDNLLETGIPEEDPEIPSALTHRYAFAGNADDAVGTLDGTLSADEVPLFDSDIPSGAKLGFASQSIELGMNVGSNASFVNFGSGAETEIYDGKAGAVSYWFKADQLLNGRDMFSNVSAGNDGLRTRLKNGGVDLLLDGGSQAFFAGSVTTGTWHHVALSWDDAAGTGLIALDGTATNYTFTAGALDDPSRLILGNFANNDSQLATQFDGRFYDLQIYDRALSAADAAYLYAHPGAHVVPYESWAFFHGLTGGALDDEDNDGVDNLSEFALGRNPKVPGDSAELPMIGNNGLVMQYVYPRRTDGELRYWLEISDNLISNDWINSGYMELPNPGTRGDGFETVTNEIPTEENQTYIRLRVQTKE